ncbi:hypothetical protein E8E14_008605 [Neopestalotiopsis sp. 37M]|nr:hypothetical protein E8E14_008605 [Neopestalotiopsis sp. 37M]
MQTGFLPLTTTFLKTFFPGRFDVPQEPPRALPQNATLDQIKYQPYLDFDRDSCYNSVAIDAQGNLNPGFGHQNVGAADTCRDSSYLENNNVYVRSSCTDRGGGWCGYMYAYYFEKDVAVEHAVDLIGHRHDWEFVAVVTHRGDLNHIVMSNNRPHGAALYPDSTFPAVNNTHAKVVYHKLGGGTHSFRPARFWEQPENHLGEWYAGALVDYDKGFPSLEVRDKLLDHHWRGLEMPLREWSIEVYLGRLPPP